MSIFKDIEQYISKVIKDKIKMGSLSKDQVMEIIKIQSSYLKSLSGTFSVLDKQIMNQLYEKYKVAKFDKSNKNDISKYIPLLPTKLIGPAAAYERSRPFGAAAVVTGNFQKILDEIRKNIDQLFPNEAITLFNSRMSNIMVLGILREIDVFCQCTTFLYTHFSDTCTKGKPTPLGYRADYVHQNFDKYCSIINDVVSKDRNYSFLKDVADLQRKNADMILYANQQSFLHYLNVNNVSKNVTSYLTHGIAGFSIFTWIISLWDDWKHAQYLKNKDFKEWLESHSALLRLEATNVDPNSPEYHRLLKLVDAYDQKIVEYDRKLSAYEKE